MERKFLIDTSAVIKFLNESFPIESLQFLDRILDRECIISCITQIELLVWESNAKEVSILNDFVSAAEVLGIDHSVINTTIEIRRKLKIKIPDALIAATAITNDLTLIADNDKDFRKVEALGLRYLNPKTDLQP
ncbi:type II toxin-antitoxin system VapC family toxin [Cecembia rubra]|uniref:PIN domain-containing protein n=1 Tax=Cecembia rubra TaxID=1485585 RepID=A0A2P8ECZ9_9BACT|nr:type II toxin-antitoxin system VapC family toxin [Cecembia rubra]PSL07346.1 hypothetical protein CLV48_101276 [Cecembia rubra]